MFLIFWKSFLKSKAEKFNFLKDGIPINQEIFNEYEELKKILAKIQAMTKTCEDSYVEIMKAFVNFYLNGESLLDNLVNEVLRESFEEDMANKVQIFKLLNKILKIFYIVDIIKLRNPQVFCYYSTFRLIDYERFEATVSPQEDSRISLIGQMTLPMGRLFFSLFTCRNFDLEIPVILSKRSKILFDTDKQKRLYFYYYLSDKYDFKYLKIYIVASFKRIFNHDLDDYNNTLESFSDYISALMNQE